MNSTQRRRRERRRNLDKSIRNKTQMAGTKKNIYKVLLTFLNFVNTIKLYHWRTLSYAEHKATDELFGDLQTNIDKFIEVFLGHIRAVGTTPPRITVPSVFHITANNFDSAQKLHAEVEKFRAFLINIDRYIGIEASNSDLNNIRDEILADVNKFMYLMTFK
jgi:Family of unknown function (DUF5856)